MPRRRSATCAASSSPICCAACCSPPATTSPTSPTSPTSATSCPTLMKATTRWSRRPRPPVRRRPRSPPSTPSSGPPTGAGWLPRPDLVPRAASHIAEQIAMVETLEAQGHTYTIDDGVYFDVSTFPRYAEFAGLDLDELATSGRVEHLEDKRHPADFALWKLTPPAWRASRSGTRRGGAASPAGTSSARRWPPSTWASGSTSTPAVSTTSGCTTPTRWRRARACSTCTRGWARGCTTSSSTSVGRRSRSRRATCSSSTRWSSVALTRWPSGTSCSRPTTASSRRSPSRPSRRPARPCAASSGHAVVARDAGGTADPAKVEPHLRRFWSALADDLNAPQALAADLGRHPRRRPRAGRPLGGAGGRRSCPRLRLGGRQAPDADESGSDPRIDAIVAEREAARQAKDFATSDRIRDELAAEGIEIVDTPTGPTWRPPLRPAGADLRAPGQGPGARRGSVGGPSSRGGVTPRGRGSAAGCRPVRPAGWWAAGSLSEAGAGSWGAPGWW